MDPVAAAKAFVKDKLDVEFVEEKSADLLNNIVRAFLEHVPYQNISTSILPPEDRFPTEKDVIESGTSLKGGLNVHNNWFFKMLLEALGYEVKFLAARIESPPAATPRKFGSHFAILIENLNASGDLHLVDVGCGFPYFKAIPLNELPYTANDVTVSYRFVEEDGRWHSELGDSDDEENWTRIISYEKEPIQGNPAEVFKDAVQEFLQEDWFMGGITAACFPQPCSALLPDDPVLDKDCDYSIRFNNDSIILINSRGYTSEEQVPQDETLKTFAERFPNIPESDIEKKIQILSGEADLLRY